jgi:uncharacterized Ntn-hydrolase superfamily protein
MTYSIVARDPHTGDFGVAVQTHQPAVGAIVPWARSGLGAVATQAFANVRFGPRALALLETGLSAAETLAAILAPDDLRERRQVAIVDAAGVVAAHTGTACIPFAGHVVGEGFSCQANMMANPGVPEAMAAAFTAATGHLAARLLDALDAAQELGGDIRGQQSAAILIQPAAGFDYRWDLRVDDSPHPLEDLRRLVSIRLADALLPGPDHAADPHTALAALDRALALNPSDETTFWFAVRVLAPAGHLEASTGLLAPLFARAPHWRGLLDRLDGPGFEAVPQLRAALGPAAP